MEEEGVELVISTDEWPAGLAGIRLGDKTYMIDEQTQIIKLVADPVWSLDGLIRKEEQDGEQLKLWQE